MIYQNANLREQISSQSKDASMVANKFDDSTINDIPENWQTYNSSSMGFSIKHPPSYVANEVTDIGPITKRIDLIDNGSQISMISILVSPGSLPEFPWDQKPTGEFTLDGYGGNYVELPIGYPDGLFSGEPDPFVSIHIQKGTDVYEINFTGIARVDDIFLNQILSTFEFTD